MPARCFIAVILGFGLVGCSAVELHRNSVQAIARTEANLAATVDSRTAALQTEQADLSATLDSLAVRASQIAQSPATSPAATIQPSPFAASSAETRVYARVPVDSDRLNSITALAFDAAGQLLVSLRAGEIYLLEDSDADGEVDDVRLIFEDSGGDIGQVSGLFVRGGALVVINEERLSQLQDSDADGIYETVTQLSTELPANQSLSQASNSIIQSPDGRYFTADVNTGEIRQIVFRE